MFARKTVKIALGTLLAVCAAELISLPASAKEQQVSWSDTNETSDSYLKDRVSGRIPSPYFRRRSPGRFRTPPTLENSAGYSERYSEGYIDVENVDNSPSQHSEGNFDNFEEYRQLEEPTPIDRYPYDDPNGYENRDSETVSNRDRYSYDDPNGYENRDSDDTTAFNRDALPTNNLDRLAQSIVDYMESRNYHLETEPGTVNIVLLKGVNPDGTPNGNAVLPSQYNDLLVLLEFENDRPIVRFSTPITTESNAELRTHPDHAPFGGPAQLMTGQHVEKWELRSGMRLRRGRSFTGLMQVGEVPIGFDRNRDGYIAVGETVRQWLPGRDGGAFVFHPDFDFPLPGTASSGCIVTENDRDFFTFIQHLENSSQEQSNPRHRWTVTLLGSGVVR
ncbi:MAG: hypothetical protein J7642_15215 [Cyanobacteria bacterium SBC]|nr:hypothetical protein [Cyanobacteria bacterium SBC]